MEYIQNNVEEAVAAFNAISEEITATGVEVEEGTKPRLLANKIPQVYEEGKKAEYDAFWDVMQNYGKREEYYFAFGGKGWTDETFKPKYDLNMAYSASQCFSYCAVTDLVKSLENAGVKFDTSKVNNFTNMFSWAKTTRLPVISTVGAKSIIQTFFSMDNLVETQKLVLKTDGSQTFTNPFNLCNNLEILFVEGVIGQNGFDIHWSTKLSADSLKSIINALSATTTGLTVTLPTTAQSNYEAVYGTGSWATLTATKSNWTIAYA